MATAARARQGSTLRLHRLNLSRRQRSQLDQLRGRTDVRWRLRLGILQRHLHVNAAYRWVSGCALVTIWQDVVASAD